MPEESLKHISLSPFSQEEQHIFQTFDKQLHKAMETLKSQKHKNHQFKRHKLQLQQQINSTNSRLVQMTKNHQMQKEKIKHQYQIQIRQLQSVTKKVNHKSISHKIISPQISPKKKPSNQNTHLQPHKQQEKPQSEQKSLSKGFKLMLLQQFIQFFAALILTRIKFPHKFRSIKRILPMTFILLRLGVFVLVTQFRKVCAYIRSVTHVEDGARGLMKKVENVLVCLTLGRNASVEQVLSKVGF